MEDGSSVLEALDLFKNEAGGIDFVFPGPIDGDDALPDIPFGLLIRQDFDLCSTRPLDDVPDHVALLADEFGDVVGGDQDL